MNTGFFWNNQEYHDLKIDDYIWYIYFVLIGINLYANKLEEQNIMGAHNSRKTIKILHLVSLGIALLFYIYYLNRRWQRYKTTNYKTANAKQNAELTMIAAALFLVGGVLFFIAELGRDIEVEEGIPI